MRTSPFLNSQLNQSPNPRYYSPNFQRRLGKVIHKSVAANPELLMFSFNLEMLPHTKPESVKRSYEVNSFFNNFNEELGLEAAFISPSKPNLRFVWRRVRPSRNHFFYHCIIFMNAHFLSSIHRIPEVLQQRIARAWSRTLSIHTKTAQTLISLPECDVMTTSPNTQAILMNQLAYLTRVTDRVPGNQGRTFGCSK